MSTQPAPADALSTALRRVLAPLARLALAQGATHATLDELLKQALVAAADEQHAALPPHRRVSRITTTTGIHRREVTRLVEQLREGRQADAPMQRSHASELFHHWRTNPRFGDRNGSPLELPRSGPMPSFEALAQGITRDVHPRSLLDELVRLGLAAHDAARDTVRLVRETFVPQGDASRVVLALGNNVGSHFEAAVDNVVIDSRLHFEQALFAAPISEASMAEFKTLVRDQWADLMAAMVPALEAMVGRDAESAKADAASAPSPSSVSNKETDDHPAPAPRLRVRLGFYTHATPVPPAVAGGLAPKPKPNTSPP